MTRSTEKLPGFCRGGNPTTIDPDKLGTLKVMGTNKEGRTVGRRNRELLFPRLPRLHPHDQAHLWRLADILDDKRQVCFCPQRIFLAADLEQELC